MTVCSCSCKLGILAAAALCAVAIVCPVRAGDIDDIRQRLLNSPMLTNSLFKPGGDSCAMAADTLVEIKAAGTSLEEEKALLLANLAAQKRAHAKIPQKLKSAEAESNRLAAEIEAICKPRGGKKFTSSLELGPEKAEFINELNRDIKEVSLFSKKFAPGSNFAKQGCPENVSTAVCGSVENDRRRMFGNLYSVFSAELGMLTALRDCASMSLRFFECKPSAVSCPVSGIMNGLSFGGNRAQFDQLYSGILAEKKLKSDGDICRQKREYYEGRLKVYRGKYEGEPQTPAEKVRSDEKAKADALVNELRAKLKATDAAVVSSEEAVSAVKDKISVLEKKYEEESKACTGKDCQPEITIARNDWEISAVPEMPSDFTATANVANGEWTFQASWRYNKVHCDYPIKMEPVRGVFFNPIRYTNLKIFGGKYVLTLQSVCGNEKKHVIAGGLIRGVNPSAQEIKDEINRIGGENSGILKKIACQESSMRQFLVGNEKSCGGTKGMPYACNEMDIGIFQVRSVPTTEEHCEAAWNWKRNVYWGSKLLLDKECLKENGDAIAGACYHNKSELMTLDGVIVNPELQKCIRNKNLADYIPEKLSDKPVPIIEYINKIDTEDKRNKYISADYVKILQEVANNQNADIIALRAKARGLKVSSRMLRLIDLVRNNYAVSAYAIEAIRRYNGGREYGYDLDPKSIKCGGNWRPHPERRIKMTKKDKDLDLGKSSYVISTLSQNPETCHK